MRTYLRAVLGLGLAIELLAAGPSPGLAQQDQPVVVRGMFGDRVLGQPLAPRLSTTRPDRTGLMRSSSGMFLGRDAASGSSMFPGMPWQYRRPGMQTAATLPPLVWWPWPGAVATPVPEPRQVQPLPAMPGGGEASPRMIRGVPAAVPVPAAPAGPDQWLRTMGGMTPPPTAGSSPTAPAATAASSPAAPAASPPPRPMPPPIQLGFAPPRSFEDPAAAVAQLIGRVSQIEKRSTITVAVENETAVLRGRVATERDRLLAESLARLQPGIWGVRNELVVENPPAAAPKSSGR